MVLAAGTGTRLGALTEKVPKPMLEVNGHPILAYILSNLACHGFQDIVINLHFRAEAIESYFGDGSRWGIRITYSHEEMLLGTAGSVKRSGPMLLGNGPVLVHYGDILTNQDFRAMAQAHQSKQAAFTLLLHERAQSNSVVMLSADHRVEGLLERPDAETRRQFPSPWVNSGIYLMDPAIITNLPATIPWDFPRDVIPELLASHRVYGFPLTGYRTAIDSPDRLEAARRDVTRMRWLPWAGA